MLYLKKYINLFPLIILVLYVFPYLYLAEDMHLMVHDNLDSNWVWFKMLVESGHAFSYNNDAQIPNLLNGIPRNLFFSEFNILVLLTYLFDIYWVYVINRVLIVIIAYFGMSLFLKNHIIKNQKKNWEIILGISLCFALLPYWPPGCLSVAGQPLIINSFLKIRSNNYNIYDWLIIGLFPMFSIFVNIGIIVILVMSLILFRDIYINKTINWPFILSILFITIVYLGIDIRLIYSTFIDNSFVSHRSVFNTESLSLTEVFRTFKNNFFYGHYSTVTRHDIFIIISIIASSLIIWHNNIIDKYFLIIGIAIFSSSLIYGFNSWEGILFLKDQYPIFRMFQFRFYWINPILWYSLFAISLSYINNFVRKGNYLVYGLLLFQIILLLREHENIKYQHNPTFKQFFAKEQFTEIRNFIGMQQSDYRVVSLGIHPSIAHYNNFFTMDAYFYNYPLSYKYLFRKTIEDELSKDDRIKTYFDDWGSRCYLFSSELGLSNSFTKEKKVKIDNLSINIDKLKEMGCNYILSSVEILKHNNIKIDLLKKFIHDESSWDIYLYQL